MGKPAKPKTLKPKATEAGPASEGSSPAPAGKGDSGLDIKFLSLLLAIVMSSILGSGATLFFLGPMVLTPAIVQAVGTGEHGEGEHGEGGAHGEEGAHGSPSDSKIGMNLELDEFTVNLKKDPNTRGNQFLRSKMSMSVLVPEEENCHHLVGHHDEGGGGGGHGGGGGPDPLTLCQQQFSQKMGRFVPVIRDIVNTSLMKRSAGQLAGLEGQEALKDEVVREVNYLMVDEGYRVTRVNLEDFIIQR